MAQKDPGNGAGAFFAIVSALAFAAILSYLAFGIASLKSPEIAERLESVEALEVELTRLKKKIATLEAENTALGNALQAAKQDEGKAVVSDTKPGQRPPLGGTEPHRESPRQAPETTTGEILASPCQDLLQGWQKRKNPPGTLGEWTDLESEIRTLRENEETCHRELSTDQWENLIRLRDRNKDWLNDRPSLSPATETPQ